MREREKKNKNICCEQKDFEGRNLLGPGCCHTESQVDSLKNNIAR